MNRIATEIRAGGADGRTTDESLAHAWEPRQGRDARGDGSGVARKRSRVPIAIAAVVLLALVVGAVLVVRARAPHEVTPTSASTGMSGMPGMGETPKGAAGSIALTAAQRTALGVTFGTVEIRPMTTDLRLAGIVTVDERRITSVAPRFGGYVERLYVNTTGQHVRRGEPLAAIYSPDVLAAEQELLVARGVDRTTSDVPGAGAMPDLTSSARRRLELWDVSSAQIDQVVRTGRASPTVTLYAPASGVVTDKRVVQGAAIQAGMELYSVADLSDVWIDADVRQTDAALARVGTPAAIEITGYPTSRVSGRVSYVYPVADSTTRTLRARITVGNADERLKPGMFATVHLASTTASALTVPRSAVVQTGDRTIVFVDLGGGRLAPRDVVLGRVSGDLAEVASGLVAGTRVVTSPQYLLDSEANLAEVMQGMTSAPSATTPGGQ